MSTLPAAELPALSVHVPETFSADPSGPLNVLAGAQDAIPEIVSVPTNFATTGRVNQPFESGFRDSSTETFGPVES